MQDLRLHVAGMEMKVLEEGKSGRKDRVTAVSNSGNRKWKRTRRAGAPARWPVPLPPLPRKKPRRALLTRALGRPWLDGGHDLILTGALRHPTARTFVSGNASRALTAAPVTRKMNGQRC